MKRKKKMLSIKKTLDFPGFFLLHIQECDSGGPHSTQSCYGISLGVKEQVSVQACVIFSGL